MSCLWTKAEEDFVRECALAKIPATEFGRLLDRSIASIRMKRVKLGLHPPRGPQSHLVGRGSPIKVAEIKRVVAAHFDVAEDRLAAPTRGAAEIAPRHVAMFLSRKVGQKSFTQIGEMFGGRDHSTVIHAVRKVEHLVAENHEFKDEVQTLIERVISAKNHAVVENSPQRLVASEMAGA